MVKKKHLVIIHGGNTFKNKIDYRNYLSNKVVSLDKKSRWHSDYFDSHLGKFFHIIKPVMPLKENAKYNDWKLFFEKFIPLLDDSVVLIGVSLGGIFLAKYLSENIFPKKILSTYLIAPPFDNSLPGEDLVGGFKLKSNLSLFEKNSPKIKLLFSRDDFVVPVSHAKKYQQKLSSAKIIFFKSKNGHFLISKFPELVNMIKKDLKN